MTSPVTNARWRGARDQFRSGLPMSIKHVVPVKHVEPAAVVRRRRRIVAGVSVLGTGLLGMSFSTQPGSNKFYGLTAAVAATWTLGGFLSGPLHLGWIEGRDDRLRRPIVTPVATGIGAFGFFYAAALVSRRIPLLDSALIRVLRFASHGATPAVVLTTCANGMAEEVFFRGALYAALEKRRPVATSTAIYTLATVSTRNPALVVAAGVMGTLFGLQRRASGGIQASTLTHLTWSVLMLRFLPPLFEPRPDPHDGSLRRHGKDTR